MRRGGAAIHVGRPVRYERSGAALRRGERRVRPDVTGGDDQRRRQTGSRRRPPSTAARDVPSMLRSRRPAVPEVSGTASSVETTAQRGRQHVGGRHHRAYRLRTCLAEGSASRRAHGLPAKQRRGLRVVGAAGTTYSSNQLRHKPGTQDNGPRLLEETTPPGPPTVDPLVPPAPPEWNSQRPLPSIEQRLLSRTQRFLRSPHHAVR